MEVSYRGRCELMLWDYHLDLSVVPLPFLKVIVALPQHHDAM